MHLERKKKSEVFLIPVTEMNPAKELFTQTFSTEKDLILKFSCGTCPTKSPPFYAASFLKNLNTIRTCKFTGR
jgi:hypothetical protein